VPIQDRQSRVMAIERRQRNRIVYRKFSYVWRIPASLCEQRRRSHGIARAHRPVPGTVDQRRIAGRGSRSGAHRSRNQPLIE
jgi:hypothetical protein